MVLFPTLSTNRTKIGKRSLISKISRQRFNGRSLNTQNRRDTTANYCQSKARRSTTDMICPTPIIYTRCHPSDTSTIRPDNPAPDASFSTFAGGSISPLSHAGGPSRPIIIVDDNTTPPSSNASSSASSSRKRKGLPIRRPQPTSRYVRCMTTGLPNLESLV